MAGADGWLPAGEGRLAKLEIQPYRILRMIIDRQGFFLPVRNFAKSCYAD
jgi:hypothetical protein